jgi:DNA-binding transcriptional regulator GbsR (MarR family)
MGVVGVDLEALQHLIHRLSQANERLSPLLDDTYRAGSQFLETFRSPQKPELEREFKQLLADLQEARNHNYHLLTFLQILLHNLEEADLQRLADQAVP